MLFLRGLQNSLVVGAVVAAVLGGLWALDEYGDRRVEKAKVVWDDEQEAKRVALETAAREAGEAAESARAPAGQPGAALRLKAMWCRDCQPEAR